MRGRARTRTSSIKAYYALITEDIALINDSVMDFLGEDLPQLFYTKACKCGDTFDAPMGRPCALEAPTYSLAIARTAGFCNNNL